MKISLLFFLTTFAALAQWRPSPFPTSPPVAGYVLQSAFPSLSFPASDQLMGLRTNAGRLFIIERAGIIYVVTNLAAPTLTVFLDNRDDTWSVGESGSFGLAFHPNGGSVFTWANETNRTAGNMVGRLARWTVDPANRNRVLPGSKTVLLDQIDDDPTHSGGDIQFGPDGYLYVPLGDEGGSIGHGNAQRIDKDFFAGILRLDVDSRPGSLAPNPHPAVKGGYRVPADNPWVGATQFNGAAVNPAAVRTEFWAVGFRNPYRISFDTTGELYVGDIGQSRWEEFDKVVRGGNYGWNWMEGDETTTFSQAPPVANRPPVNFQPPLWTYPHTAIAPPGSDPRFQGACAIGGFVYRGTKYPNLNGKYLAADLLSKNVWAITLSPQIVVERIAAVSQNILAFGMNPLTGDILVVSRGSSVISKLAPAPDTSAIPATLSATGVFSDLATMTPADGVLPYEVASPFWSDYAVKTRWFFLPPGGSVSRSSSDTWTFPAGTVWVKHFDLPLDRESTPTQRIETRFFVATSGGGYGLTYRWRANQLDADLVPDAGADTSFQVDNGGIMEAQPWHYPARSECMTCHNPGAGLALGFSSRQLNVPVAVSGGGVVNQLLGLSALGVFDREFTTVAGVPQLSRPQDESFSLEHRFKSFADANCAYCHQPGGPGRGGWDARFSTPVSESSVINGAVLDDLEIAGAAMIKPGQPAMSILFRRVNDMVAHQQPAEYHMPPLATAQLNTAATNLLVRYINSLAERTFWQIGTNGPADFPHAEFVIENAKNDPAPGSPTLRDDDFYFAGSYPAGFNGLKTPLVVSNDEAWTTWERANTANDMTNRIHFVTQTAGQLTLDLSWLRGGSKSNDVAVPGFGRHDMVIQINKTPIYSGIITASKILKIQAPIPAGPSTIEIIRTGPKPPNYSAWINYDYVTLTKTN